MNFKGGIVLIKQILTIACTVWWISVPGLSLAASSFSISPKTVAKEWAMLTKTTHRDDLHIVQAVKTAEKSPNTSLDELSKLMLSKEKQALVAINQQHAVLLKDLNSHSKMLHEKEAKQALIKLEKMVKSEHLQVGHQIQQLKIMEKATKNIAKNSTSNTINNPNTPPAPPSLSSSTSNTVDNSNNSDPNTPPPRPSLSGTSSTLSNSAGASSSTVTPPPPPVN